MERNISCLLQTSSTNFSTQLQVLLLLLQWIIHSLYSTTRFSHFVVRFFGTNIESIMKKC